MARGKLRCIMGCLRLKSSYREKSLFSLNNVNSLMELVDRNGVFKDCNTLKHENDLQNNLCFHYFHICNL